VTRAIAAVSLMLLLVACGPAPAPLEAGGAQLGTEYRYVLYDHCRLDTVPIEFDGSEWRIEGPTGGANPPAGFGNPEDEGIITLDSADTGTYRSSGGVERRIIRVRPIQPKPSPYLIHCL
jgi:hypothetical protein